MTTLTILELLFQLVLITVGAYAILHEKQLVKFERKVAKYVKAFFKALYLTAKEKKQNKNQPVSINNYRNEEYEEMLGRLNKASKIEEVLVA